MNSPEFRRNAAALRGQCGRCPAGSAEERAHWESLGARRRCFTHRADGFETAYSVLTPRNMAGDGALPLVYCLHGEGETEHDAEHYGFGHLAAVERFLLVCPRETGHAGAFPAILGELEQNGYRPDRSRVYVAGYGAGSAEALRLGLRYPELVACAASMPGPSSLAAADPAAASQAYRSPAVRTPLICVGGARDPVEPYPLSKSARRNLDAWLRRIAKVEARPAPEGAPSRVERVFGLPVHRGYVQNLEGAHWYVGDFFDADDRCAARLIAGEGVGREIPASFSALVWMFARRFSRGPAGALRCAEPLPDRRVLR